VCIECIRLKTSKNINLLLSLAGTQPHEPAVSVHNLINRKRLNMYIQIFFFHLMKPEASVAQRYSTGLVSHRAQVRVPHAAFLVTFSMEISVQGNRNTMGIFRWHRKLPFWGTETLMGFSTDIGKMQFRASINPGQKQETLSTPGRVWSIYIHAVERNIASGLVTVYVISDVLSICALFEFCFFLGSSRLVVC